MSASEASDNTCNVNTVATDGVEKRPVNIDVVEAINLLAQAKRNLMCAETSQAVGQLQDACRMLSSHYGEFADECADAYFLYGKALLELARTEGGVLGSSIPIGDSEDSSNSDSDNDNSEEDKASDGGTEDTAEDEAALSEDLEDEEVPTDVTTTPANSEAPTSAVTTATMPTVNDKPDLEESLVDDTATVTPVHAGNMVMPNNDISNTTTSTPGGDVTAVPSTSVGSDEKTEQPLTGSDKEEEEVSSLQLAWEMLELAKLIYSRQDSHDVQLKLADTHLKLGEVGLETEQYDQAICDLSQCLGIQSHLLAPDDRRLAETYFQLALACTYDRRYDDAINHYHGAIRCLTERIAHLDKVVTGVEPPENEVNADAFYDPVTRAMHEAVELRQILPDIQAKIEDVEDERRNAAQVRRLMTEDIMPSSSGCVQSGFSSVVSQTGWPQEASTSGTTLQPCTKPASQTDAAQPVVHDISHLVRKKRKSDNAETEASKRSKPDTEPIVDSPLASGDATIHAATANGTVPHS